jgi:hypothetical protein
MVMASWFTHEAADQHTAITDEFTLMVKDHNLPDDVERVMQEIDNEKQVALEATYQQELDAQRAHEQELSQMQDDVLYHIKASTDEIIAGFEHILSSSEDDCFGDSPVNEHNCDFYRENSESSSDVHTPHIGVLPADDDINANTDTEDGAEDMVELIQANKKLLHFLKKQSETIARLRGRIVRLGTIIQDLTVQLGNITPNVNADLSTPASSRDLATVLMDTKLDTSFLLKPNRDTKVEMRSLDHIKIKKHLEIQMARIAANQNSKDELWMYFDSGASRSVISTTSPIRQHLQALGPAYGSCSIGDGTPLQYLEKGHVRGNLLPQHQYSIMSHSTCLVVM